MRKVYYIYNPKTGCYDRIHPTFISWLMTRLRTLGMILFSFLLGASTIIGVLYYTGRPYKVLDEEVYARMVDLERDVVSAREAVDVITNRDENLYRVIMQTGERTHRILHGDEMPKVLDGHGTINQRLASVDSCLFTLKGMLYECSYSYDEISKSLVDAVDRRSRVPSIIPISGFDLKKLSSGFGYRSDPFTGEGRMHNGLDFPAKTGTPVRASAAGTVKHAGWSNGYGYTVVIDHGFGFQTEYAHLNRIIAKAGAFVQRGEDVGEVGSTGRSTGAHLHYEVKLGGKNVNPVHYMSSDLNEKDYYELLREAADRGATMD